MNSQVMAKGVIVGLSAVSMILLSVSAAPPSGISFSAVLSREDRLTRKTDFNKTLYLESREVYDLYIHLGPKDPLVLRAVSKGDPSDGIIWFKLTEGDKLKVKEGRRLSLVPDLSINNSIFVVSAYNKMGNYSVAINVHLTCSPNFTVHARRAHIEREDRAVLGGQGLYYITIAGGTERVTLIAAGRCGEFVWYKLLNGELHLVSRSPKMILEVTPIVVQDAFFLVSDAKGGYNVTVITTMEYPPTLIDVREFEIYPEEDGKVETRCTADARPAANISYYKIDEVSGDKRKIPSQDGWMRINTVRLARDAGWYVCEAHNVHGNISAEFLISGRPKDVRVVFKKIERDSVVLKISAYSNSPVEFKVILTDTRLNRQKPLMTHTTPINAKQQKKQIPNIVQFETITGLEPNTPYDLDLTATNNFGESKVTAADFVTDWKSV